MGFKIENGTGNGAFGAAVDSNNNLHTLATTVSENHQINRREGLSFFVYSDITPTAAGDVFMYIKNDSPSKELVIDWYRVWTAAGSPEAMDVFVNDVGTPAGTTALAAVNRNLKSGNAADATMFEGVDITGLSGGSLFDRIRIAGGSDVVDEFRGAIILGQNDVITFRAVNGAIPIELTIAFYFEEPHGA